MKRSIVLLSLLSSVMMFSPQSMGMEESKQGISTVGKKYPRASSFTQDLRSIVDNYGNNKDQLKTRVKELYDNQIELKEDFEDFIKYEGFSNDECTLLFDIAKELNLPIIVGTDSLGISLFSIYKGKSIKNLTRIDHGPFGARFDYHAAPDGLKLTTFFISDHFTYLNSINLDSNKLTDLRLPINLPYFMSLFLSHNNLAQLNLGDMPNLSTLDLLNNQLNQLNLGDMPNLSTLDLKNNQLTQLKLGDMPNISVLHLPNNQLTKLKLGDMPKLDSLFLENNQFIKLTLGDMPNLDYLYLSNNQLAQLKLGDMSKLDRLCLNGNKIEKLNFLKSNMPILRYLNLENNPLKNLTLPYKVSHHTGLVNKDRVTDIVFNGVIPSITAFYCPSGANAFNEKKTVDFSVLDPKKHTFKNMNFLNEVERERNCDKILGWMRAHQK